MGGIRGVREREWWVGGNCVACSRVFLCVLVKEERHNLKVMQDVYQHAEDEHHKRRSCLCMLGVGRGCVDCCIPRCSEVGSWLQGTPTGGAHQR